MWLVNVFNDLTQLSLCSNKMWAIIRVHLPTLSTSLPHTSRLNAFVNFVVWKMSKLFIPFLPFLSLPVTDFFLLLFSLKKIPFVLFFAKILQRNLSRKCNRWQETICRMLLLGIVWSWPCSLILSVNVSSYLLIQWARHHEWDLLGHCLYVLQQLLTKNVWLLFTCFVRLKSPSIHNSQGLLTKETSLSFLDRF